MNESVLFLKISDSAKYKLKVVAAMRKTTVAAIVRDLIEHELQTWIVPEVNRDGSK